MKTLLIKTWTKLSARSSLRKVNEFLFDCSIHGLGILNYENDQVSGELRFLQRIVPRYADSRAPVVIDVGANIGDYTALTRSAFPDARVFAFEPNPANYQSYCQRFSGTEVIAFMKGLGASEGRLKFYDRKDCQGVSEHGSLYRGVIEDLHHTDAIETEVAITTLDAFASQHSIDHICLLKIDTEGHELEVLKGASESLRQGKIDLIHVEFNEMNLVSRVFFRDFTKLLSDYVPYRLLPTGAIELKKSPLRTELFAFQNIVFIHRRFSPDKAMLPSRRVA